MDQHTQGKIVNRGKTMEHFLVKILHYLCQWSSFEKSQCIEIRPLVIIDHVTWGKWFIHVSVGIQETAITRVLLGMINDTIEIIGKITTGVTSLRMETCTETECLDVGNFYIAVRKVIKWI